MPFDGAPARRWCRPDSPEEAAAIVDHIASGAVTHIKPGTAAGAYRAGRCRAPGVTWHKAGKIEPQFIRAPGVNLAEDYMIAGLDRRHDDAIADMRDAITRRLPELLTRPQWFVWSCRQYLSVTETAAAFRISKPTVVKHYDRGRLRMLAGLKSVAGETANNSRFSPTGVGVPMRHRSKARGSAGGRSIPEPP